MTDTDLSEFFKYSRPKKRPCQVGFVLDQLKPKERDQLVAACSHDKNVITGAAIREWLKARGFQINDAAISSHRRGVCSCGAES